MPNLLNTRTHEDRRTYPRNADDDIPVSLTTANVNASQIVNETTYRDVVTIEIINDFRKTHHHFVNRFKYEEEARENARQLLSRLLNIDHPPANIIETFLQEVVTNYFMYVRRILFHKQQVNSVIIRIISKLEN